MFSSKVFGFLFVLLVAVCYVQSKALSNEDDNVSGDQQGVVNRVKRDTSGDDDSDTSGDQQGLVDRVKRQGRCPNGGVMPYCCENGSTSPYCCANNSPSKYCCGNGSHKPDCS